VEVYVKKDHDGNGRVEQRVKTVADSVGPLASVQDERFVPRSRTPCSPAH